jgi:hypothetical protein
MIQQVREQYNASFTEEKYAHFLQQFENSHPGMLDFRVAETPVFIPKDFKEKLLHACESITDLIVRSDFKALTARAIPANVRVPGEDAHTHFIAFDFGVCKNAAGELEPQLIEMQGFPTLFAYQVLLADVFRNCFEIPATFDSYLGGYTKETYLQLLKKIVVGEHDPQNVILLEIYPDQQKTRIDFACTEDYLGVKAVCLTQLIQEGKQLFYMNNGMKTAIKRIYNRLIFDDLHQQQLPEGTVDVTQELDVEWAPHPNWFYRISKYTMPMIDNPYVPKTFFLSDIISNLPSDLENYVLKPLFSFAGQGVIIDVTKEDIAAVKDPENWILQRKVQYAEVIATPDMPAKCEIRVFYFWEDGAPRPVPVNTLSRLSKGKMIGVRYNADKTWVGGTACFFEA